MSWVYPQSIVQNLEWYDQPPGYGILPALMIGDDENVWTPAAITANELILDMGVNCEQVHIRAKRGNGTIPNGGLLITFTDTNLPPNSDVYFIDLINVFDWQDFYYTPPFPWRYVSLEGVSIEVIIGVSLLRAESEGVAVIPRRLLSGVGR